MLKSHDHVTIISCHVAGRNKFIGRSPSVLEELHGESSLKVRNSSGNGFP